MGGKDYQKFQTKYAIRCTNSRIFARKVFPVLLGTDGFSLKYPNSPDWEFNLVDRRGEPVPGRPTIKFEYFEDGINVFLHQLQLIHPDYMGQFSLVATKKKKGTPKSRLLETRPGHCPSCTC